MSNLRILKLKFNNIGNESCEIIKSLNQLTLLNWCGIGSEGIEFISQLENLTRLNVFYNNIGDLGAEFIGNNLKKLKILNISQTDIGNLGLSSICTNLLNLRKLDLSYNSKITSQGIEKLGSLNQLHTLLLTGLHLGKNGIVKLCLQCEPLYNLRYLNLSNNEIGPKEALFLTCFQQVTSLNISHNNIGKQGVKHVCEMNWLSSLDISNNNIDQEDAQLVEQNMKQLHSLILYSSR